MAEQALDANAAMRRHWNKVAGPRARGSGSDATRKVSHYCPYRFHLYISRDLPAEGSGFELFSSRRTGLARCHP
jgi:hypothetical protein